MSFEVTGNLIEKYPAVDVSGKFRKREFVISRSENSNGFEFLDYIKFQLTQDRCNLIEKFKIGDIIKVSFNLRGRKWEKDGTLSYFTNLEAWRIEELKGESLTDSPDSASSAVPLPGEEDLMSQSDNLDDLPF